jgi:hypothetical protein
VWHLLGRNDARDGRSVYLAMVTLQFLLCNILVSGRGAAQERVWRDGIIGGYGYPGWRE